MKVHNTPIDGLFLLEPKVFGDSRGHFFELFNCTTFQNLTGFEPHFVQDNQSLSAKNVLRGLHFQVAPREQGKLVKVARGAVRDVAVDIRPNSPTFGKSYMVELNDENHLQLWLPPGMAHGFLTLQNDTIFQYKVTDYYSPEHERCIAWNDPELNVDWGVQGQPIVSEKDTKGMSWGDFKKFAQNQVHV